MFVVVSLYSVNIVEYTKRYSELLKNFHSYVNVFTLHGQYLLECLHQRSNPNS